MQGRCAAREDRTVVANGDHVVKILAGELVDRFRPVAGNVDAEFPHDSDRLRTHQTRLRAEHVFERICLGGVAQEGTLALLNVLGVIFNSVATSPTNIPSG